MRGEKEGKGGSVSKLGVSLGRGREVEEKRQLGEMVSKERGERKEESGRRGKKRGQKTKTLHEERKK